MNRLFRLFLLTAAAVSASACATLVGGGSSQGVSVSSEPSGASFTVKSASGMQMAAGTTPQMISLPRKNEYAIEFSVPGYRSQSVALTKGVNGWVFGNFIVGWIPGLIIDFVTGSANKLEPATVQVALQRGVAEGEVGKLFGVVRQLDASGHVVSEKRVELEPVQ
ncbi:MAG TPA: hypothetical protein VM166_15005 [Gemmatimonadaceae bacterium]|nr:hypothetical protein [Gemmatimonadaceae bacterium]